MGVCAHQGERCWPCIAGQCYPTPRLHQWWDARDVAHAAEEGYSPPSGDCGCAWCGWPAVPAAGSGES